MHISDRKVHAELFKPREERIKSIKFTNVYVKYIPKHWSRDDLAKIFEDATGGKLTKKEDGEYAMQLWQRDYGVSACLNFETPDAAKAAVEKLNGKETSSFGIQETESKDDEKMDTEDASAKKSGATGTEEEAKTEDKAAKKPSTGPSAMMPTKLYVARAQKTKERKEYLSRQQRKRGMGARRNYTGANLYVKNLSPDVDDSKLTEMFANFGVITSAKVMREPSGKSRGFGFVAFEKKEAATRAIHEMTNTLHHGKVRHRTDSIYTPTLRAKAHCLFKDYILSNEMSVRFSI